MHKRFFVRVEKKRRREKFQSISFDNNCSGCISGVDMVGMSTVHEVNICNL